MSKKVLHVIDSLTPGGAERVALELVNALAEDGHPVALCATRDGLGLVPELSPAVDMFPLQRKRTWDLGAIRRLTRTIREHDVQILHAHGRSSTKFCALVKLLSGRQVGLLFHDHYGEIDIDAEAEPSLKAACRLVDRYVAVDPELAEWAVEVLGVAADLVSVIGNSIDLRRFSNGIPPAGLNDARQPLKAAMVANFRPQKDHNLLLQALARAPRARENLHVYLAGFDGDPEYMADCLKLVEALDLEANVTFLGGRTDVPAILKAADIGLLSSRSETGPLVLLEYMAAGLPFIATHTGHVAEKVAGEGLPFFSEPGDIRSYAENLEAIVALPAGDRAALGEIGQELVRHEFDLRQKAGAFIRLYQEILDPSEELHTPNRVLHSSSSERIEQPKDRAFLAEDRIV